MITRRGWFRLQLLLVPYMQIAYRRQLASCSGGSRINTTSYGLIDADKQRRMHMNKYI
jgi:hypothetical protein